MKRFLQFEHRETGEIGKRYDVSHRSERDIEKMERGMLANIGPDWFVNDVTEPATA